MVGRKQFKVDDAVEAAMRVFWAKGYAATTVQDLVAGTGLGRGSLYGAFGDKSRLFLECLHRYASTVAAELVAALQGHPDDPLAALTAMYEAILRRMSDSAQPPGCLIVHTACEVGVVDPDAAQLVHDLLRAQLAAVQAVTEAGRRNGALRPDTDPVAVAEHQVAVAQALAVLHRAGSDGATLRRIVAVALAALPVS